MAEMALERGLFIYPSCILRWVQIYGPELDKLLSGPSETHEQIRIKGQDRFLYRAVDSTGQTIEFRKSAYGWPEGIYLAIVDERSCLSRNIRGAGSRSRRTICSHPYRIDKPSAKSLLQGITDRFNICLVIGGSDKLPLTPPFGGMR